MLSFIIDIIKQPAFLLGLFSFCGLVSLRKPAHKVIEGTLIPIAGYVMIMMGAGVIIDSLDPLGKLVTAAFHVNGVVPNNEVIVSLAINKLGMNTMWAMLLGLVFNILIAKFTKYKYVFLSGHHSFYMACMLTAVLYVAKFSDIKTILIGGFFLGAWSAISPAIGQHWTSRVTNNGGIAMGHFGSLAYYLSAWIAGLIGSRAPEKSTENAVLPEKYSFLRDPHP